MEINYMKLDLIENNRKKFIELNNKIKQQYKNIDFIKSLMKIKNSMSTVFIEADKIKNQSYSLYKTICDNYSDIEQRIKMIFSTHLNKEEIDLIMNKYSECFINDNYLY